MPSTTPRTRSLILAVLDWTRPKDPPLSLGAASILTQLKHHGLPATHRSWAVNAPHFNPREVIDWALAEQLLCDDHGRVADFGVGAFVWNERHVRHILPALKREGFRGRIIVGGPQISYVSSGLEALYPDADVFVRGYAEDAMVQLMSDDAASTTTPSDIVGVHYKGERDRGLSAKTRLENLVSPFLAGLVPEQSFIRWETQRGCPFSCAFCQHRESDLHRREHATEATRRRLFDADRVRREATWICSRPVIKDVAVLDPTFNSGGDAYLGVLDRLTHGGFRGKIALQCRLEMVKDEFLERVQQLQAGGASVVLEFGLQTVVPDEQKVIRRRNNLVKCEAVLEECRRRGITFEISLIYGLPLQTLNSFKLSVAWARSQSPSRLMAFPLMLLRGTELHDRRHEYDLVESSEVLHEWGSDDERRQHVDIPVVVSSSTFTFHDWREMSHIAERL